MRYLRFFSPFLSVILLAFCLIAMPALSQDVMVMPPKGNAEQSDEKSDKKNDAKSSSWLDFLGLGSSNKKDAKSSSKNAAEKKDGSTYLVPPSGKQPKDDSSKASRLPKEIEEAPIQGAEELNAALKKLEDRPTQVIQQPDYTETDDRKFNNEVTLRIGKLDFSEADLAKTAQGTELKPDTVLKNCEPRFSGVITGENGEGESFEIRGKDGKGRGGYKKTMYAVHVVLSLACKLSQSPVNKGMISKMGDYYLFGISFGYCYPKNALIGGNATVTMNYTGQGTITCDVK